MYATPYLSLCMPTNGVVEWVFPVLDSIFSQGANSNEFEVVVTDNGINQEFKRIMMEQYVPRYKNLVYKETEAPLFLNEIESFKCAKGELIKFVNHRTRLIDGSVEKLIRFAKDNVKGKPVVYFSNGAFPHLKRELFDYQTFDLFVKNLSYWSSWSTGITIWRTDFDEFPENTVFNYLFPHTTVLFKIRNRDKYIIDNTIIMDEIPVGNKPKGTYDLFHAFAVEYPGILLDLLRTGDITKETFLYIKKENLGFLSSLYYDFIIRKNYCSYDLSSYQKSICVFYSHAQVCMQVLIIIGRKMLDRIRRILHK